MDIHPERFSVNNLATFSARGPTVDGRVKPDIVTIGEQVVSSFSRGTVLGEKCRSSFLPSDNLVGLEGTSMASPLAGSAATLIRQYFQDGYYPSGKPDSHKRFNPSAALVKAMMIHSARQIDGLLYLLSQQLWWPLTYKDGHRFSLHSSYHQGFGRIELNNVLGTDSGLYIPNTEDAELSTGIQQGCCVNVKGSGLFKVTLVWTDYPSTPNAMINLVNDLDLIIVMPDGTQYYGNGKYSPVQSTRDEADYLNNVEQFSMDNAPSGLYNIIVRGSSVPKGPQPYALVISGSDLAVGTDCIPYKHDLLPERAKYRGVAYAFGVTGLITVPALFMISMYLFMQYRAVAASGYKQISTQQDEEKQVVT
jgi:hypothetical protein